MAIFHIRHSNNRASPVNAEGNSAQESVQRSVRVCANRQNHLLVQVELIHDHIAKLLVVPSTLPSAMGRPESNSVPAFTTQTGNPLLLRLLDQDISKLIHDRLLYLLLLRTFFSLDRRETPE